MSPVPPDSSEASQVSVGGDLRRLKDNSAATVAELREFLQKMQGKSPQEVLGMVAASGLITACVQATVWCVILLAAFTAGPYYYEKAYPSKQPVVAQQPAAVVAPVANQPAPAVTDAAANPAAANNTAAAPASNKPDLETAAKKMGMDETKTADPKKNPLENNLDKLLDKLE